LEALQGLLRPITTTFLQKQVKAVLAGGRGERKKDRKRKRELALPPLSSSSFVLEGGV
jgi:hypothetical protein